MRKRPTTQQELWAFLDRFSTWIDAQDDVDPAAKVTAMLVTGVGMIEASGFSRETRVAMLELATSMIEKAAQDVLAEEEWDEDDDDEEPGPTDDPAR